jgi:hypothetical protein
VLSCLTSLFQFFVFLSIVLSCPSPFFNSLSSCPLCCCVLVLFHLCLPVRCLTRSEFCSNQLIYATLEDGRFRRRAVDLLPVSVKVEPFDLPEAHFAYPGIGLRVKRGEKIKIDEDIGMYAGVVVADNVHLKARFAWALSDGDRCAVIDAEHHGNLTRFINDGVHGRLDGRANCSSVVFRIGEVDCVLIRASQEISELQELLLDYGEDYWQ